MDNQARAPFARKVTDQFLTNHNVKESRPDYMRTNMEILRRHLMGLIRFRIHATITHESGTHNIELNTERQAINTPPVNNLICFKTKPYLSLRKDMWTIKANYHWNFRPSAYNFYRK